MSNLQKTVLKSRLPPTGVPTSSNNTDTKRGRQKDYTPIQWNQYFAEQRDVTIDIRTKFKIYLSKTSSEPGPLLLLLHGGGFSALTWSHFSVQSYSLSLPFQFKRTYSCTIFLF